MLSQAEICHYMKRHWRISETAVGPNLRREGMPRRNVSRPTVERKIYFYRVDAGLDEAGRPVPFDPAPTLRHIDKLPFTDNGRYLSAAADYDTCCWVDRTTPGRLRLGNVRRAGLPQVERAGSVSPLSIPPRSGLLEETHIAFFPDNIVGTVFNFHGPRISRLAHYFELKANGICPAVTFEPLLRQDIVNQLQRLQDIRLLQLKIRAPYSTTIAQADRDLGNAFEAAARAGDAEELEIILRPPRYSRRPLSNGLMATVRRLTGREDLREEVSKFVVKGYDPELDRVELVDILNDYLIARKRIVLIDNRTRALDAESAYRAIEEAYKDLRGELLHAAGVRS